MPAIAAAAAAKFGSFLFLTLGTSAWVARVGAAIAYFAVTAGSVLALNSISKALLPKPPKTTVSNEMTVSYSDTASPGIMVLGRIGVGGMNVIPAFTSGARNDRLHQVLAASIHEINAIPDVYFGQDKIPSAHIDASGNVIAPSIYASKASIRRYLGTSTQTVDATLSEAFPTDWDANHRGRGNGYAALWYDILDPVFKNSVPEVLMICEGAKGFDPRTSTTDFTISPALLSRWLLTLPKSEGGLGVVASLVDDTLCGESATYGETFVDTGADQAPLNAANTTVTGSGPWTIQKTGGVNGTWDAAARTGAAPGRCKVSWRAAQTNLQLMMALNSDPNLDNSFTSLDYAMECDSDGQIDIWESNVEVANNVTTYTASDDLAIEYDGLHVRYWKNTTLLRKVYAGADRLLDFDSSFAGANATVNSVRFRRAQPRYTCNVALTADMAPKEKLRLLARAMLGWVHFAGGKWRIRAGRWPAGHPHFAITDAHILAGPLQMQLAADPLDKFNQAAGVFVDETRLWQVWPFETQSDSSYETQDGGRQNTLDVELPTVTDAIEAQRHARLLLRQSRNDQIVTFRLPLAFEKILPGETGTVTCEGIKWTAKSCRCMRRKLFPRAGYVEATFKEELATDWNDLTPGDYLVPGVGAPAQGTFKPLPPTNVRTTAGRNGFLLEWNAPTLAPPGITYDVYQHTAATPFSSATLLHGATAQLSLWVPRINTDLVYLWVVARFQSLLSVEAPTGNGVPGKANIIDTNPNVSLSPTSLNTIGNTSPLTSGTCTATPSGGTGPYTHAWTRISGSTDITANSPTGASTTFNGANLIPGEVNEAIFRDTVTDSLSATATADVSVRFERLAFTVSASSCSGFASGFAASGVVATGNGGGTANPNTTPNNGVGPFTYLWEQIGTPATNGPFNVSSTTAQNPTWSETCTDGAAITSEQWRVTVTDTGNSNATTQKTITVTLEWTNLQ